MHDSLAGAGGGELPDRAFYSVAFAAGLSMSRELFPQFSSKSGRDLARESLNAMQAVLIGFSSNSIPKANRHAI
jgi:hypothetical protein